MPVKLRTPKARKPVFDPDVIALFVRCEGEPRQNWSFSGEARALAHRLGLYGEFLTGNTPLDRADKPHASPEYIAHKDWFTCRRVRLTLLAAAEREPESMLAPQ